MPKLTKAQLQERLEHARQTIDELTAQVEAQRIELDKPNPLEPAVKDAAEALNIARARILEQERFLRILDNVARAVNVSPAKTK